MRPPKRIHGVHGLRPSEVNKSVSKGVWHPLGGRAGMMKCALPPGELDLSPFRTCIFPPDQGYASVSRFALLRRPIPTDPLSMCFLQHGT